MLYPIAYQNHLPDHFSLLQLLLPVMPWSNLLSPVSILSVGPRKGARRSRHHDDDDDDDDDGGGGADDDDDDDDD